MYLGREVQKTLRIVYLGQDVQMRICTMYLGQVVQITMRSVHSGQGHIKITVRHYTHRKGGGTVFLCRGQCVIRREWFLCSFLHFARNLKESLFFQFYVKKRKTKTKRKDQKKVTIWRGKVIPKGTKRGEHTNGTENLKLSKCMIIL